MRAIIVVFVFYAFLGLIAAGMSSTFPGLPPYTAIDDLVGHLQTGVAFPEFWNPFTQEILVETSYADYPGYAFTDENGTMSFVGCANDIGNRTVCLETADGDASYVQFNYSGGFDRTHFVFNYSNPEWPLVNDENLRGVVITIQCKTISEGTGAMAFHMLWAQASGGIRSFCPTDEYGTITLRRDYPDGFNEFITDHPLDGHVGFPFEQANLTTGIILVNGTNVNQAGAKSRFTYFRIDIIISTAATCRPPEGAWFPFADAVACAIINFANFVWKGIQFIASGIAFVVLAIANIFIFIGALIVKVLAVPILGITWLSGIFTGVDATLGAVVTVIAALLLLAVVLEIVGLARGTGSGI